MHALEVLQGCPDCLAGCQPVKKAAKAKNATPAMVSRFVTGTCDEYDEWFI